MAGYNNYKREEEEEEDSEDEALDETVSYTGTDEHFWLLSHAFYSPTRRRRMR